MSQLGVKRILVTGALFAVLAVGAMALVPSQVEAKPFGGPLCGPSYLWSCSKAGGPDILFAGTVCEKARFEKKTGTTCVPLGG